MRESQIESICEPLNIHFAKPDMLWFIYAALFLRILFFDRFDVTSLFPSTFHEACGTWTFIHRLHPVFSGLLCGSDLPAALKSLFLQLGIYHWFVASGGHLVFLQAFLQRLHVRHFSLTMALLFAFSMTCGMQPPIVRAFMGILLARLSLRWALFLRSHQITLLAGLASLLVFPKWYTSFSFQLSWLVALALPWSSKHFLQSLWVSILLIPLSFHWSFLHLLYNIVLTPLFSVLLFPLSIFFFAIAPWTLIGNSMWEFVVFCCQYLPKDHNPLSLPPPLLCWVYILSIHCAHLIFQKSQHA